MNRRLDLSLILREILGSPNVYFQPPESIKMKYPCIRYSLSNVDAKYADNKIYADKDRYSIIVIDKDPDSVIFRNILKTFQYISFDRFYTADNLNHWSLILYY